MPEYLAPGVYVEESAAGSTPIPGIPTSAIDIDTARRLVAAMRPVIEQAQPGWPHFDLHDPGITLVELFAFVSEALLYRAGPEFDQRRKAVLRAATDLTAAAGACVTDGGTLKRPHYFAGQLLDAATLELEQAYQREKRRRHNRYLHGCGIVCGLGVRIDATGATSGARVVIEPGYAIDANGDDVAITTCVRIDLPHAGEAVFVSIRQCDLPCAIPVPAGEVRNGCIEDACLIAFAADVTPPALAIARLLGSSGAWALDAAFRPSRTQPSSSSPSATGTSEPENG